MIYEERPTYPFTNVILTPRQKDELDNIMETYSNDGILLAVESRAKHSHFPAIFKRSYEEFNSRKHLAATIAIYRYRVVLGTYIVMGME